MKPSSAANAFSPIDVNNQEQMEANCKSRKSYKKVPYTLPPALFAQTDVQHIVINCKTLNHVKTTCKVLSYKIEIERALLKGPDPQITSKECPSQKSRTLGQCPDCKASVSPAPNTLL